MKSPRQLTMPPKTPQRRLAAIGAETEETEKAAASVRGREPGKCRAHLFTEEILAHEGHRGAMTAI